VSRADDTLPPWLVGDTNPTQPIPAAHMSLEAPEDGQADDQTLPAWLRDPEPVAPNNTQPIVQHAASSTLPPIEHAHNGNPNETAPELPFWLREESTTAAAPTDRTPAAQGQQDIAQPVAQYADEDALPAWLRSETTLPIDTPPSNNALAALSEPATTTVSDEDALPAWLFAGDAPRSDGGTTPPLGNPLPSTTSEPVSASATVPAASPADELPMWLRDDMATPPPVQQNDTSFAAQDLPAWLRDDPFSSTSPNATTASDASATWQHEQRSSIPADNGSELDSLPVWLRDDPTMLASEQPMSLPQPTVAAPLHGRAAEQASAMPSVNEPLPAWLRDEAHGSTTMEPAAQDADVAGVSDEQHALPAWLHNDASSSLTDSSSVVLAEPLTNESVEPAPIPTARVYDAAAAPQMPSATTNDAAPEQHVVETAAVYDVPAHTEPSAESIAAMLATPVATPEVTPAVPVQAATPAAVQKPVQPVVQPSMPSQVRPTPTMPPQPAQRGNRLWIVLAVVLVLAVLAVGWLALQLNGFI